MPRPFTEAQSLTPKQRTAAKRNSLLTEGNLEQNQAQKVWGVDPTVGTGKLYVEAENELPIFETAAAATDLYIALQSLLKLSLFMFSEHEPIKLTEYTCLN